MISFFSQIMKDIVEVLFSQLTESCEWGLVAGRVLS